jgi:cobalamin biosynthesis protein CobD/CbiB
VIVGTAAHRIILGVACDFLLDDLPHWDHPTASILFFANEVRRQHRNPQGAPKSGERQDGTGHGNDDVAARHLKKALASKRAKFLSKDHAVSLGHNGRGATHRGDTP